MEYIFSDSLAELRPSAIREIFKSLGDPEMIAFAAGNPSPEAFPVELVRRECGRILAEQPVTALQYGTTEGYTPLRRAIKSRLTERFGHTRDGNDVMVTTGGEQGIELACKALCNPGDAVLCEEPSFIGALNSFRSLGAVPVGVPMDADGINVEAFEEAAVRTGARLAYLIPTFQNPSGITMSAEKRRAVYEIACRHSIIIIEDNPYGELRFSGEDVPTIKSMDTEGRVLYAGSFSKVMAPAFRLGFLVFDKSLTMPLTIAKQTTDVHSNVLFQYVCNEYMTKYDFASHLEKSRSVYREKCRLMLDTMRRTFHPSVTFPQPEGGLFVMAFLPEGMDAQPFVREAIKRGVLCVPGSAFLADEKQISNAFRLNYSTPSDEQIVKGIEILGRLTHEWVKEH